MTSEWGLQRPRMSKYWIERFLWSAGFLSAALSEMYFDDGIQPALDAGIWRGLERSMPTTIRGSGFEVVENNAGVVVRYKGRRSFEKNALAGYREALSWCVYNVEEVDDPDREGRRMLKILPIQAVEPPSPA